MRLGLGLGTLGLIGLVVSDQLEKRYPVTLPKVGDAENRLRE